MITSNKAVTMCTGLATLTINGTASPLCVGEIATQKPFAGLEGFDIRGIGIPVSDKKLDGVISRQESFSKIARTTRYSKLKVYSIKEPQQFLKNSSTLIKNVSEDTFFIDITSRTNEFGTGKKTTYTKVDGKVKSVKPKLTPAETIICVLYEYAHDVFRTESGIEIKVSFSNGVELEWK